MHPRIVAERNAQTDNRIRDAAAALARFHNLPEEYTEGLTVKTQRLEPDVRRLFERIATADLLEEIVKRVALMQSLPPLDPKARGSKPRPKPEGE